MHIGIFIIQDNCRVFCHKSIAEILLDMHGMIRHDCGVLEAANELPQALQSLLICDETSSVAHLLTSITASKACPIFSADILTNHGDSFRYP